MISIIVPIYKVERFINKCIDSILTQTYKDLEIILVDDGSPDHCPAICDEYAKSDNRIKVIHKKNGGLICARKSGLKASSGEYVCFVDGDDWIEPDMYEKVADSIKKYHADCVITQFYYSTDKDETKSDYHLNKKFYSRQEMEREIFPTMLFARRYFEFGVYPCCWTKVFKRELLEKHLLTADDRLRMGEDIAFTYPCLMECLSISFINEPLYHYRSNPDSMTKAYDRTLPDIFHLPYETLVNKSRQLQVDISNQLGYYLLYLIAIVLRNEANGRSGGEMDSDYAIKKIIEYKHLKSGLKNVHMSYLPFNKKLLLLALKLKSRPMIKIYLNLL